ncbi:MAG: hypothetical protein AAFR35_01020 [Pseudomonadota bacterium]
MRYLIPLLLLGAPASASNPMGEVLCAPRADLVEKLSERFQSVPMGRGIRGHEQVVEVWSNPRSGDWTIVVVHATGRACIVAFGENWESANANPA